MKEAYSFMEKSNTKEIHIFEGKFTEKSCTAPDPCICEKMDKSDGSWVNNGTCKDEQQAREKAAELGRKVCGDCVSHLYETY